jgi:hypothetical protein
MVPQATPNSLRPLPRQAGGAENLLSYPIVLLRRESPKLRDAVLRNSPMKQSNHQARPPETGCNVWQKYSLFAHYAHFFSLTFDFSFFSLGLSLAFSFGLS